MTFKDEIRDIVVDWGKYMDTYIPKNTNADLFVSLKYSNKERLRAFCEATDLDRVLVEQVAIADFLLQDNKTKEEKCKQYLRRDNK